jgi:hypothetical protein
MNKLHSLLTAVVAMVVAAGRACAETAFDFLEGYMKGTGLILQMANPLATESNRLGDFLLWEQEYNFSRERATLITGQNLKAGTVLGLIGSGTMGTVTFAGTGNGVCTKDATTPVLFGAKVGNYTAKCVQVPGANLALFEVIDPLGKCIGNVGIGATFAREIKFVIADGATDFIVGDTFTFPVNTVTGKYTLHDAAAVDGSQNAAAVLINDTDATSADTACAVLSRHAILKSAGLTWKTGITAQNKANGVASLYDRARLVVLTSA